MTVPAEPASGAAAGSPLGRALRLEMVLAELLRRSPELEAAAVVSYDGLAMASALPASMDEDRVAAMSAALLSLGERAAEGLGRGELSQVYIEGQNGTVFLISARGEAVLVAVARKGAKAGLVLFELKGIADVVGRTLQDSETDYPVDAAVASAGAARDVAAVVPPVPVGPAGPAGTPVPVTPLITAVTGGPAFAQPRPAPISPPVPMPSGVQVPPAAVRPAPAASAPRPVAQQAPVTLQPAPQTLRPQLDEAASLALARAVAATQSGS